MIKNNAHKIYFLIFTALLLLTLCLVAMHLGAVKFSVAKGFELLFSPDNSNESFVLHHTRIPRIIAALIIGGALSLRCAVSRGYRQSFGESGHFGRVKRSEFWRGFGYGAWL